MIYENLPLNYLYQIFSPFKESEIDSINCLVRPSRSGRYIKFKCYGNASFSDEDIKHENVTIKELEKFERKNTNVIVFEVVDETYQNVYTELFLYQNVTTMQSSYALISYNSNTKKISHKIQIDKDPYDLMIALSKAMLYMQCPNPFDKK